MGCGSYDDYKPYEDQVEEERDARRAIKPEDIEGDFIVCVRGKQIKKNEGLMLEDHDREVFLIAHKSNPTDWYAVEKADFLGTSKMVYKPEVVLASRDGGEVVAWVEVTGDIKIKTYFGTYYLRPETVMEYHKDARAAEVDMSQYPQKQKEEQSVGIPIFNAVFEDNK